MKRILLLCVLLLVAFGLSAQVKVTGATDFYVTQDADDHRLNTGQDVNIAAGPVSVALTLDWAHEYKTSADTLPFTYVLGFSKAFGAFTPGLKLSGDQTFALDAKTANTGNWFSDLEPSLGLVFGKFGADLYSDISFQKGYELIQTVDTSVFWKPGIFTFRVGFLYMDPTAVVDDIGYPNAPVATEGYTMYVKAGCSY